MSGGGVIFPYATIAPFFASKRNCRSSSFVFPSALDGAGNNALNDILLAGQIQHDDRDDGDHDAGHHRAHLHAAVAAAEVLDRHRNGTVFLDIQHQRRQEVVVPDPHGLQNRSGDRRRLENREDHLEEDLQRIAAVDHRGFLNRKRNGLHEAREHEYRKTRAEAEVDDADVERRIQLQRQK